MEGVVNGGGDMTPATLKVLDFVRDYSEAHFMAPTIEEIRVGLGRASKSGIARQIDMLVRDGLIRRTQGSAHRNLRLVIKPTKDRGEFLQCIPTRLMLLELERRREKP